MVASLSNYRLRNSFYQSIAVSLILKSYINVKNIIAQIIMSLQKHQRRDTCRQKEFIYLFYIFNIFAIVEICVTYRKIKIAFWHHRNRHESAVTSVPLIPHRHDGAHRR